MRSRIVWTARERQAIAVAAAKNLDSFTGMNMVNAVRLALKTASVDGVPVRHRNIQSKISIGDDLIEMINLEQDKVRKEKMPSLRDLVERENDRMAAQAATAEVDMLSRIGAVMAPAILSAFRELMQSEIPKIVEEIRAQTYRQIMDEMTRPSSSADEAKIEITKQQDTRPRVIVYGPMPAQANFIQESYGASLNLSFAKEVSEVRRALHSDSTIVQMVKFTAHLPTDVKRKSASIMFATGGLSSVQDCLNQIVKHEARSHV